MFHLLKALGTVINLGTILWFVLQTTATRLNGKNRGKKKENTERIVQIFVCLLSPSAPRGILARQCQEKARCAHLGAR